jgi:hypothetical protein
MLYLQKHGDFPYVQLPEAMVISLISDLSSLAMWNSQFCNILWYTGIPHQNYGISYIMVYLRFCNILCISWYIPDAPFQRRRPGHGGSTLPAGPSMDAPVVAQSRWTGRNGKQPKICFFSYSLRMFMKRILLFFWFLYMHMYIYIVIYECMATSKKNRIFVKSDSNI